jgi:hypothetical protein
MAIRRKYIRNIHRYLGHIPRGASVRFGVRLANIPCTRLDESGAPSPLAAGDAFLTSIVGATTRFNANGREIPRRDLPMETVYSQREWTWMEWHGRERVHRTGIADVPHRRYQRDIIEPPTVELHVADASDGTRYLAVEAMPYLPENEVRLRHNINLLLELFGECELLRDDLAPLLRTPVRRVNWELLPQGELPWEQVRPALEPIVARAKPAVRPVVLHRFKTIESYGPAYRVAGRGGFAGYIAFAFPDLGLYVLENATYGNATYVLEGDDWQALSQLTKAELLAEGLHKARIIHRRDSWERALRALLRPAKQHAA